MGAKFVLTRNLNIQETDLTQKTIANGLPLIVGVGS
jgi:hypothetical protein